MNRLQNQYKNLQHNEAYKQTSYTQQNVHNTKYTSHIDNCNSTPETKYKNPPNNLKASYNQSNVEMRTKHFSASQRRCKSAVPANFQDQNWNEVTSSDQKMNDDASVFFK